MTRTRAVGTCPRRLSLRPLALAFVVAPWLALSAHGQNRDLIVIDSSKPPIPAPVAAPPTGPMLTLVDGGFASGTLEDCDRLATVRWQAPGFASPLEFGLEGVESIRFPLEGAPPRPSGNYGFELSGGDVLFGSLLGLDDKVAEIDATRLGKIRLDRARILRMYRWNDGADLVYLGPNGLAGWREGPAPRPEPITPARQAAVNANVIQFNAIGGQAEPPAAAIPRPRWQEDSGQLVTSDPGASLYGDFGLPPRASIEVELSWKTKPDFALALGISDNAKSDQRAFRLEVWEGFLVALRETEGEGDLASLQPVASGAGRAHLLLYLDQEAGRLLVSSVEGKTLADLKIGGKGPAFPAIRLTNVRGDLRVERLRIGRWNGEAPQPTETDRSRIHLGDGSVTYGQVERYDAAAHAFVVRNDGGETRIEEAKISSIHLSKPLEETPRPAVRAVYQDGVRIGGRWIKVEGGGIFLTTPGVDGFLRAPLAGLRSLDVARRDPAILDKDPGVGTLIMDGSRLTGRLADATGTANGSCLAWKPLDSEVATPLKPGVSGKIYYKAPPAAGPAKIPASDPRLRVNVVRRNALAAGVETLQNAIDRTLPPIPERKSLYLLSGDIVPAEILKIDDRGVTFKTDISPNGFVPNDKIKAVELATEAPTIRVNKSKRERLLMLPRMQRNNPPTHLIRSKTGDFLRGRIVAMDAEKIQVEVRLETKELPRDRVSRIIWLHPAPPKPPEDTDAKEKAAKPAPEPAPAPAKPTVPEGSTRVQAVKSDGIRLTFLASQFATSALTGESEVLGKCSVAVKDLDTLLIGDAVEKEAVQLAYQDWKLHDAPDPKAYQDGPEGGLESPLVGKPAPDFTLAMLDGSKFHLAEAKGQVVVLDFWATWCGPCLQAMPQVDRVAHEFADRGVKLVAVNLQEPPAKITALLDRIKLSPAVALDRDGVVAEKYQANAIPQTVIIDREGKLVRLFVGAGPQFEDQLREALKATLNPPAQP
jgi:thiol-disulfide isomerase/thioredoxin